MARDQHTDAPGSAGDEAVPDDVLWRPTADAERASRGDDPDSFDAMLAAYVAGTTEHGGQAPATEPPEDVRTESLTVAALPPARPRSFVAVETEPAEKRDRWYGTPGMLVVLALALVAVLLAALAAIFRRDDDGSRSAREGGADVETRGTNDSPTFDRVFLPPIDSILGDGSAGTVWNPETGEWEVTGAEGLPGFPDIFSSDGALPGAGGDAFPADPGIAGELPPPIDAGAAPGLGPAGSPIVFGPVLPGAGAPTNDEPASLPSSGVLPLPGGQPSPGQPAPSPGQVVIPPPVLPPSPDPAPAPGQPAPSPGQPSPAPVPGAPAPSSSTVAPAPGAPAPSPSSSTVGPGPGAPAPAPSTPAPAPSTPTPSTPAPPPSSSAPATTTTSDPPLPTASPNVASPAFTVIDVVRGDPQLSSFRELVEAAGQVGTLERADVTVFAPTNEAIAALLAQPGGADLLNDPQRLAALVARHVVVGNHLVGGLFPAGGGPVELPTVGDQALTTDPAARTIDGATVTEGDRRAENGALVHVVDRVLVGDLLAAG